MIEKLLDRIRVLEEKIEKAQKYNKVAKEKMLKLFQECKIEKSKKKIFKDELLKSVELLSYLKLDDRTFENNYLSFSFFLDLVENYNGYLVIVSLPSDALKEKFLISFLMKKVSPLFTKYQKVAIGMVEKEDVNSLKEIKSIPYFDMERNEIEELKFFSVIFEGEKWRSDLVIKAVKVFEDLQKRPSLRSKRFVEYSLISNKIVDFEKEEFKKEKDKYNFVFDESYPNLETKIKANYDNIPFVLTLLERIDLEMEKLKESKGLENIVNRILSFLERKATDNLIKEEVLFLKKKLHSK